jgi:hypothetical protein
MEMQTFVVLAGLLLGAVLVIGAVAVGVKKAGFAVGELGMTAFGVVLVGLSLWSRVSLEMGGLKLRLDTLQDNVEEIAQAATVVSEEVGKLNESSSQNRDQVNTLIQNLGTAAIRPEVLQRMRVQQLAAPQVDLERLSGASRDLQISADAIRSLRSDPVAVQKARPQAKPPVD